VNDSLNLFP
jgi:hypothetical protein